MGALHDCRAVNFDSCNNLLSSVYTILVIILWYVRLNIKMKVYFKNFCIWQYLFLAAIA